MSPTRGRGRSAMGPTMLLGDFLVAYLNRLGVTHIFGLPGDLVLGLFHRFGRDRGLEIVTFSHEPGVDLQRTAMRAAPGGSVWCA